jgi:hypothetical protein
MQRMYEEKRMQMERGSIGGSYFVVQLPDGTMEKRLKMPINADPGVHSSLALDQLAGKSENIIRTSSMANLTCLHSTTRNARSGHTAHNHRNNGS